MNRRNLTVTLVATLLVVVAAIGYLVAGARPSLGLDLQGGISAIYTPVLQEGEDPPEDFDAVLDQTIEIIRSRVDSLGVAEPDISRQGDDVLVQLPGLDDADRAQEIIGTTAKLSFRPVEAIIPPGSPEYDETPPCDAPRPELPEDEGGVVCAAADEQIVDDPTGAPSPSGTDSPTPSGSPAALGAVADVAAQAASPTASPTGSPSPALTPTPPTPAATLTEAPPATPGQPLKYRVGPAAVTGDQIEDAFPQIDPSGGFSVSLVLEGDGADAFAEVTSELACQRDQGQLGLLAIVLDGVVESAPGMNPGVACGVGLTGGNATITTGGETREESEAEADDLAVVLQTGALPISLEPSTFETVSPTLGSASLRAGLLAGLIGLVLVAIYLTAFYRWLGLVAISALLVFGVLIFAIITLLGEVGFALTLAGVAGIIVSVGIAADSSIIFFERLRDEVSLGKTVRTSTKRAFESAFRTNLAGNTVTLAAAVILYFLAVGPVRGFALTLGIATVLDIIILATWSRSVVGLLGQTRRLTPRSMRAERPITEGVR